MKKIYTIYMFFEEGQQSDSMEAGTKERTDSTNT